MQELPAELDVAAAAEEVLVLEEPEEVPLAVVQAPDGQ